MREPQAMLSTTKGYMNVIWPYAMIIGGIPTGPVFQMRVYAFGIPSHIHGAPRSMKAPLSAPKHARMADGRDYLASAIVCDFADFVRKWRNNSAKTSGIGWCSDNQP